VQLLLVRHAIAEDGSSFDGRDTERPLTADGRRRFERGATALAALVPDLELVLRSPLVRARQTAELLIDAYSRRPAVQELDSLEPGGDPVQSRRALAALDAATLAVVGHEPSLSALEGLLLTGTPRSIALFKKGGAALLDWRATESDRATLLWHLTAGQLRQMAHRQ